MKRFLWLALLLLMAATAHATQPVINSITWSSSLVEGQAVTLSGSSFGTKARPGPYLWFNGAGGNVNPSNAGVLTTWTSVTNAAYTASTDCYSGGCIQASAGWSTTITDVSALLEDLGYGTDVYYSFKRKSNLYYAVNNADPDWNWKSHRGWAVSGGSLVKPDFYLAGRSDAINLTDTNLFVETTDNANNSFDHTYPSNLYIAQSNYVFEECEITWASAAGNHDGKIKLTQNCANSHTNSTWQHDTTVNPGREVWIQFQMDPSNFVPATEPWLYLDEVYLDSTKARIVVSTQATYGVFGHYWMQPCTAWNDTAVTFTLNQSNLPTSQRIYIYAINKNGEVSSPVSVVLGTTVGGGGGTVSTGCGCPP